MSNGIVSVLQAHDHFIALMDIHRIIHALYDIGHSHVFVIHVSVGNGEDARTDNMLKNGNI